MNTLRMQSTSIIVVALTMTFAQGCGFVREVKRTQTGGEIAIRGRTDSTEKEAADLMHARCNGAYDIIEEGEVVVGQQTITSSQGQGTVVQHNRSSNQVTQLNTYNHGTSTTQNTTEWRILYQCKAAGAVTPAPGAVPPGDPTQPTPAPTQARPESRLQELRIRL